MVTSLTILCYLATLYWWKNGEIQGKVDFTVIFSWISHGQQRRRFIPTTKKASFEILQQTTLEKRLEKYKKFEKFLNMKPQLNTFSVEEHEWQSFELEAVTESFMWIKHRQECAIHLMLSLWCLALFFSC